MKAQLLIFHFLMKMEKDNVASFISSIRTFGSLIKFSHTVFALPFAFTSLVFASYQVPVEIIIKQKLIWIILAMVGARSAAMGFNRVVDRSIDAQNPRTQTREIPAGKISVSAAWIFIVIASAALIFASYMLNERERQLLAVAGSDRRAGGCGDRRVPQFRAQPDADRRTAGSRLLPRGGRRAALRRADLSR